MSAYTPIEHRFWPKVAIGAEDECWEWQAYRNPKGYGIIRPSRSTTFLVASRVSWELTHGPIPEGLCVCHSCDNPPCCNPAHLFLGTKADNAHDMYAKGRRPTVYGEATANAKLTEDLVREVKRRYSGKRGEVIALAREYGIHPGTLLDVLRGRTWSHVS
jgi:hypothetical protein